MFSKSVIFLPFLDAHGDGKTALTGPTVRLLIYQRCGLQSLEDRDMFYSCIIFLEGFGQS